MAAASTSPPSRPRRASPAQGSAGSGSSASLSRLSSRRRRPPLCLGRFHAPHAMPLPWPTAGRLGAEFMSSDQKLTCATMWAVLPCRSRVIVENASPALVRFVLLTRVLIAAPEWGRSASVGPQGRGRGGFDDRDGARVPGRRGGAPRGCRTSADAGSEPCRPSSLRSPGVRLPGSGAGVSTQQAG
jgi:hypothetical protein